MLQVLWIVILQTTNLDGEWLKFRRKLCLFMGLGPIIFSNNTLTPNVTVGGTYTISVTNLDNGCATTKTIFVNQDITPPTSTIVPPTLLSCSFPTVALQPNAPSNSAYFLYLDYY